MVFSSQTFLFFFLPLAGLCVLVRAKPVQNALLMATALRDHNVPLEMHIYPHGEHGLALANDQTARDVPACQLWPELAVAWLRAL